MKTGLTDADLKGKLVLDVGCGTGRFMESAAGLGAEVIGFDLSYAMESAAGLGAEVIGFDLSYAVEAACKNVGAKPGMHVLQADLFKLPFRPGTFDAIYSIGVLHHTPDTRQAFLALSPLLKKGGLIAIWVYAWAGDYSRNLDRVRACTVGIPHRILYGLCCVIVPLLHALASIQSLRHYTSYIPVSNQGTGLTWDILDTFDNYSPKYQWKHSEPEVLGWFKEAGLEVMAVLSYPVSVRGRRP
jgi:SAM-dependent methyltransferase